MNQIKMIFCFSIISAIVISCNKKDVPESKAYDEFLKIELSSINSSSYDSIFLITVLNLSFEEFEQDCELQYQLINQLNSEAFHANQDIFNKQIPSKPAIGYLNLQSGGNYNHVINLNNLLWDDQEFSNLDNGEYKLIVSLYIKDPVSPNNIVSSNILSINK